MSFKFIRVISKIKRTFYKVIIQDKIEDDFIKEDIFIFENEIFQGKSNDISKR